VNAAPRRGTARRPAAGPLPPVPECEIIAEDLPAVGPGHAWNGAPALAALGRRAAASHLRSRPGGLRSVHAPRLLPRDQQNTLTGRFAPDLTVGARAASDLGSGRRRSASSVSGSSARAAVAHHERRSRTVSPRRRVAMMHVVPHRTPGACGQRPRSTSGPDDTGSSTSRTRAQQQAPAMAPVAAFARQVSEDGGARRGRSQASEAVDACHAVEGAPASRRQCPDRELVHQAQAWGRRRPPQGGWPRPSRAGGRPSRVGCCRDEAGRHLPTRPTDEPTISPRGASKDTSSTAWTTSPLGRTS
jgi:hypothetical protein